MPAAASVTETKQVFRALIAIGVAGRDVGRDGWQVSDAGLIIKNDKLQQVIVDALEGSEKIPYEFGHMSFSDTIELVSEIAAAAKMFESKPSAE